MEKARKLADILGRVRDGEDPGLGRRITGIVFLAVSFLAFSAKATVIYNFHIFNNSAWENDNRLRFTVSVSDEGQNEQGKNQAGFLFENFSSINSSIAAIYFDDGSLLNMNGSFLEGQGVNFSPWASPQSLPGGNTLNPPFDKKPAFSADSDPPTFHNGINESEWLKIVFTLKPNRTFDNVITELSRGGTSYENLRIGLHIQGLPNGDSVSAINYSNPQLPIPEPATLFLFMVGLLMLKRP